MLPSYQIYGYCHCDIELFLKKLFAVVDVLMCCALNNV